MALRRLSSMSDDCTPPNKPSPRPPKPSPDGPEGGRAAFAVGRVVLPPTMAFRRLPSILCAGVLIVPVFTLPRLIGEMLKVSCSVEVTSQATSAFAEPRRRQDPSEAEIALPPDMCRLLNEDGLHRRHERTPELDRLEEVYALSEDVLRTTGFVRGGGIKPGLLGKVAASEPVTVLTMGGSFTRGHGCAETMGTTDQDVELHCAWPARFERWWGTYLTPRVKNHFVHFAEHGAGSVQTLQRIGVALRSLPQKPDLVILDFLVNDVFFSKDDTTVGYESLVRAIQELLPLAQLILVEAGCRECRGDAGVLRRRQLIAQNYDIPAIDYAAMVQSHNMVNGTAVLWPISDPPVYGQYVKVGDPWPEFSPECNVTRVTCCPNNHPPWPVHQYFSDSVAYGLVQMLREGGCKEGKKSLQDPLHPHSQLDRFPSCTEPLISHDALVAGQNSSSLRPISHGGKWQLYEDRPGRPGWITTEVGATITFPIRFGARPMLAVTFLRSYAGVGTAEITFSSHSGGTSAVRLDGRWDKKFSLPDTVFFIDRIDGVHGNLLGPLQGDGYNNLHGRWNEGEGGKERLYSINVTLVKGEKFKITQVTSC